MFQALKNRNIALLFGAQVISVMGDLVMFVALPFWIFRLTGSALATGIMFAVFTIPQLVLSPIAGVFVDRLDRKRIMIASDVSRGLIVLGYLFVNTADQVWILYVLAFLESCFSQVFRPAALSVVPNLVSDERALTRANSALGSSWAVAQLAGPALGGALVAYFGPHSAALFDSASYFASALLVILIHIPLRTHAAARLGDIEQAVAQISHELLQGVRVVLDGAVLRVIFTSLALLFLSQGIINALLVVLITQYYHGGAPELGSLISAQGVGGVIGALLVGALAARISPRQMIVGGAMIASLLLAVFVNQSSVLVALGLMVFIGISVVAFDVGLTTLIQLGSDDDNRGRVTGLMQTAMAAAQLVSIGAASLLADRVGALPLLDVSALLFGLGGLVALLAPKEMVPQARSAPQPAE